MNTKCILNGVQGLFYALEHAIHYELKLLKSGGVHPNFEAVGNFGFLT